jgi:DNA-binding FadR family transcriptional regulator
MDKPQSPALAGSAFAAGTLGQRVAVALRKKIQDDGLAVGTRLPSEQAMATHFQVSRNIVREAIALLKQEGVLDTRKGSGAFVSRLPAPAADALTAASIESLLNVIEVRQGLEGETAALAALRRTPAQLLELERALLRIETAVVNGQDGVAEDFHFHLLIAQATGNSAWARLVEMFARPIRSAVQVTRANEARRAELAAQVLQEHRQILAAITDGSPENARAAAIEHMQQAANRVRQADREFWQGDGGALARQIV